MHKQIFMILLLATLFVVMGCSTYWYQEGKSFDQCKRDRAECRTELLKRSDLKNLTVQYEVKFMENCMTERGYRLVTQEELPLDVKREEPDTSLHWRTVGVAGTLSEK